MSAVPLLSPAEQKQQDEGQLVVTNTGVYRQVNGRLVEKLKVGCPLTQAYCDRMNPIVQKRFELQADFAKTREAALKYSKSDKSFEFRGGTQQDYDAAMALVARLQAIKAEMAKLTEESSRLDEEEKASAALRTEVVLLGDYGIYIHAWNTLLLKRGAVDQRYEGYNKELLQEISYVEENEVTGPQTIKHRNVKAIVIPLLEFQRIYELPDNYPQKSMLSSIIDKAQKSSHDCCCTVQ